MRSFVQLHFASRQITQPMVTALFCVFVGVWMSLQALAPAAGFVV